MSQIEPKYKAFAKAQPNYFDEAQNGFIAITGLMLHSIGYDPYVRLDMQESSERIKVMRGWRDSILKIGGEPQHLYIYDETARIEVGDYFTNIHKEIIKATEDTDWVEEINKLPMKLIASTDVTLGLSMVSDAFRKYFISVGGNIGERIMDVYVEDGIAKINVLRLEVNDAKKAGMSTHSLERDSLNRKITEEAEQFNFIIKILEDYKSHMECHISQYCDKREIMEPAVFLKPYLKARNKNK